MKPQKLFLMLIVLFTIGIQVNAQNATIKENVVTFPTITDYEYFANNPAERNSLEAVVKNSAVQTLSKQEITAEEIPEFLQTILNQDYIVAIGSFYIKLDIKNNKCLAVKNDVENAYTNLVNSNTESKEVMQFILDKTEVLEVLKKIENGEVKVEDYNSEPKDDSDDQTFRCKNATVYSNKLSQGWHKVIDKTCPVDGKALQFGDLKLVYQSVGIYFSLQSKGKNRQACVLGGNPNTAPEVSAYMYLEGNVRYQACTKSEKVDARLQNFSLQSIIQWRPYEGTRLLVKYDFTVQFKYAVTSGLTNPYSFPLMNIKFGY